MSESAYEMKESVDKEEKLMERERKREEWKREQNKQRRMFYDHMKMATLTHESINLLQKLAHDRKRIDNPLRTFFKRVLYIHKNVQPEEKPFVVKRSLSPSISESSGYSMKEGITFREPPNHYQPLKSEDKVDDYAPSSPQFSPTYCEYEPTSPIYDYPPPPEKKSLVEHPQSAYHQSSSTSMDLNIPPMSAEMHQQRRSFDEELTKKLHAAASSIQASSSSAAMHQQMRHRDQRVREEQMQQHNHRQAVPGSIARDYRAPTPTPSVTSSGSSERSRAQRMILTCPFCSLPHHADKCEKYYTVRRRTDRLRELNLCVHCLEDHDGRDCSMREYDRWCPVSRNCGQHHFALCPVKNP